jgi:hypothetical protein
MIARKNKTQFQYYNLPEFQPSILNCLLAPGYPLEGEDVKEFETVVPESYATSYPTETQTDGKKHVHNWKRVNHLPYLKLDDLSSKSHSMCYNFVAALGRGIQTIGKKPSTEFVPAPFIPDDKKKYDKESKEDFNNDIPSDIDEDEDNSNDVKQQLSPVCFLRIFYLISSFK